MSFVISHVWELLSRQKLGITKILPLFVHHKLMYTEPKFAGESTAYYRSYTEMTE